MRRRVQLIDALDGDDAGAGTVDDGAHLVEHRRQVDDFRLAGGVLDDGRALGERRGHQDVLGRADTGELEGDLGAEQLVRLADDGAVFDLHPRAEGA